MKYICDHAGMLEKCKECEFSKIHEEAGCCKQPGYCDIDDDTGYNTKCVPFKKVSENEYGVHNMNNTLKMTKKNGDIVELKFKNIFHYNVLKLRYEKKGYKEIPETIDKQDVITNKTGVHQTHCCIVHGCKYGDADCPVVNEKIQQDHPCMDCNENEWIKDNETNKWYHGRIFVNSFDEAFDKKGKWKNHVLGIIMNEHIYNNRYNLSFHYKSLFDLNRQIEMLKFVDSLDKNDRELINDYVKEQITIESYNEVE